MNKIVKALVVTLVWTLIFASTMNVHANGNGPSTEGETNISSILTYDEMIESLEQIERTSRRDVDVFTLADYGTEYNKSEQGRDLYVAKVGDGPKKMWVQSRIHGDEPYGAEASIELLKKLGNNGSKDYQTLVDEFTLYFIPMYNPDGSEMNIRQTVLWDQENDEPLLDQNGNETRIDLNRDWAHHAFEAKESKAFYEFWTDLQPDYVLDIHHQGLKEMYGTGETVTMSLGISLAPGGPTLPGIKDGAYDELTRQMQVHVYDALTEFGHITIDRYQVGQGLEIDIHGGVVSAMMLGLDHEGLNPEGYSNPAIFFETSGNTRDGNLGQRSRGKLIRQNEIGIKHLLLGLANGEVYEADADRWDEIPHRPTEGYQTDHSGIVPVGY
ncbi:M14 family zinc carboxypeptidase [Alteribacter populi]|uniref:M14 family zinc carboxypeptidase n=1 Tax=Alteribacter populi TaxID=2011011 RepID=UPI000BBA4C69|nr:M14 family zinc carboxypeptidase [Alteribacter populi]